MTLKILIVDDREENISPICNIVESEDVEVITALSGEIALKKLLEHEDVGLALIDVHMPEMNGYELASIMRSVERTKHIPIIFVTADTKSEESHLMSHGSGAVDMIFKPVNPNILRSKVTIFKRLDTKRRALTQKIAELEEARAEAEQALQRAAEADRLKGAFIASVSHEIRTPLTAITGFAELLKRKGFDEKTRDEYLDVIIRSGNNLIQIVNDILDLSKIEADQLTISHSTFSPSRSLEDTVSLLNPLALKNNVKVNLEISTDFPKKINSAKTRFEQILVNLIGNAIKFTKNGTVSVKAETLSPNSEHGPPKIQISVIDTGIGIDPALHNQLFKPFNQANTNISQTYGGTGLGLALSKKLAQLLGGNVSLVKSAPNEGTIMAFECCNFAVEDNSEKHEDVNNFVADESLLSQKPLKGLKILFVDDSLDNQILVETVLSDMGAKLFLASSGFECLEKVKEHSFDIILMDYRMPGLNGFEATKKLNEQNHKIPVILLTANAIKGEKENALGVGAAGYVTKPIIWTELITEILRATKRMSLLSPNFSKSSEAKAET